MKEMLDKDIERFIQ